MVGMGLPMVRVIAVEEACRLWQVQLPAAESTCTPPSFSTGVKAGKNGRGDRSNHGSSVEILKVVPSQSTMQATAVSRAA